MFDPSPLPITPEIRLSQDEERLLMSPRTSLLHSWTETMLKCTKPRGELVVIQPTALRQAGPGGVQEALCQYEATFPGAQSCAAETLQELEKSLYKYAYYLPEL